MCSEIFCYNRLFFFPYTVKRTVDVVTYMDNHYVVVILYCALSEMCYGKLTVNINLKQKQGCFLNA